MKRVTRNRARVAVLGWFPVAAVVAALFAVPGTEAAAPLPLTVHPAANTYGGEKLVISGDMGSGEQRIFLQRGAGGSVGSPVVDPRTGRNFTMLTQADGKFSFVFPAFAMDGLFIRVVSARAVTVWHETHTIHQEAELGLIETTPAEVPLPRGFVVVNEPFRISVDTVNTDRFGKPGTKVLPGRMVALERRVGTGWTHVESAAVRNDGRLNFSQQEAKIVTGVPEVYRAVLQPWTQNGAQIGRFHSLPFYLEAVRRPDPVRGLRAEISSPTVKLLWTLPVDPTRGSIVILRTQGGVDPDLSKPWQRIATLAADKQEYVDQTSVRGSSYRYAVYTRSKDGVYTRVATEIDVQVPSSQGGAG